MPTLIHSAFTDEELHEWLIWADEKGSSFLRVISEAAFVADSRNYNLLRPVLLKLKAMYPEIVPLFSPDPRMDRAEH